MEDRIICLIGESGSGKDFISNYCSEKYGLKKIKSYTTRKPRNDLDYNNHIFIKEKDIRKYKDIVASTVYNSNTYFATASQINDNDIYVVDIRGLNQLKQYYRGKKEIVSVYIKVSAWRRLYRMLKRGDGIKKAISRIIYDRKTFKYAPKICNYIIDNNKTDIDKIAKKIFMFHCGFSYVNGEWE